MKSLTKNSIYNSIYSFSNVIFPLIMTSYASRVLLPEGIGYVNYAKNIASYFVTFAALGIPNYGLREIAKVKNNKNMMNKLFSELFIVNLINSIIFTILYLVFIFNFNSLNIDNTILLCFGVLILMNIFNIDWFYQGIEKYGYIVRRSLFVKIISLILTICFVKSNNDIFIFAVINVCAITFNYFFNILYSRNFVRISFNNIQILRHFKPLILIGLSIFLSALYSKVDITMLGYMTSTYYVGLYTNSQKIIEALLMLTVSITAVYLPRLSALYDTDKDKFVLLINYGIRIISFIAIPLFAYTFMFSSNIVTFLFGYSFADASMTLKILSILIMIKSFGDLLCYQVVLATRTDNIRLISYFLAAVTNIVLNNLLIRFMYHNGAAVATVVTELIVNATQFLILKYKFDLKINIKYILISFFSSLISIGFVFIIFRRLFGNIIQFITCSFIMLIIYLLINIMCENNIFAYSLKK